MSKKQLTEVIIISDDEDEIIVISDDADKEEDKDITIERDGEEANGVIISDGDDQ